MGFDSFSASNMATATAEETKTTGTSKASKQDTKAPATKRAQKKDLMKKHAAHDKDTGSIPVQIALLTEKITALTEHLKLHPKDEHSRRGLLHAVGKRRKLLKYYKEIEKEKYDALIEQLGLRG